jgi:hypothetical protein
MGGGGEGGEKRETCGPESIGLRDYGAHQVLLNNGWGFVLSGMWGGGVSEKLGG